MVYLFNFRYFVICLLLHFQLCLVTYALYTAQALYKHRIGFQGLSFSPNLRDPDWDISDYTPRSVCIEFARSVFII